MRKVEISHVGLSPDFDPLSRRWGMRALSMWCIAKWYRQKMEKPTCLLDPLREPPPQPEKLLWEGKEQAGGTDSTRSPARAQGGTFGEIPRSAEIEIYRRRGSNL